MSKYIAARFDAIIEAVPDHEAVLVLEREGSVSTPGVFTSDHRTITIGDTTSGVAVGDMIGFGFHHVLDGADHLMARQERQPRRGQVTLDDVQVGAAHGRGLDADENLVRSWLRIGLFPDHQ